MQTVLRIGLGFSWGILTTLCHGQSLPLPESSARNSATVRLVEKVEKSVVALFVSDDAGRIRGSGSGVIIHPDGFVLTNDHVLRTNQGYALIGQRVTRYTVIGRLPEKDLGVVRLRGLTSKLPAAPLGHSHDARNGESILAFGNPGGRGTIVTSGIISSRKMFLSFPNALAQANFSTDWRDDYIQFDAAINMGNSGGPLVNMDGEVIGIVAKTISKEQNVSFAIPVDRVRDLIDRIVEPELIAGRSVGLDLNPRTNFALVTNVHKGSAAQTAGVQAGDIIESMNNTLLRHAVDWNLMLHQALPKGQPIELVVRRGETTLPIKVTPERLPPYSPVEVQNAEPGLAFHLYEGKYNLLPEFDELTPAETGTVDSVQLSMAGDREDHYALRFQGYVKLPESGLYRITVRSDDGSRVALHDQVVIHHDGPHPPMDASRRVRIRRGMHPIRVDYFESTGAQSLELKFELLHEGSSESEVIAPEYFFQPQTAS